MRTQALAKPEVGDFLSKNYVAVYDKVGTFTVTVGADGKTPNRNGGNVAAFFCTPSGYVIHAVAGPRTSEAFLAEAKWATAVYAQIQKDVGRAGLSPAQKSARGTAALKLAHATALDMLHDPKATGPFSEFVRHTPSPDPKLNGLESAGRKRREQVHRLLKSSAFEPLATVGPEVYAKVLGETVTAEAVKLTNAPEARQAAQPAKSLLEFYARSGAADRPAAPPRDASQRTPATSTERRPAKGAKNPNSPDF